MIASFYQQHASTVLRLVASRVRTDSASIEDVCQTAWLRLCTHPEVDLAAPGVAIGWLVVTATREASKLARARTIHGGRGDRRIRRRRRARRARRHHARRPLELAIDHEHHRTRRDLLLTLTARARQFLGLQGAGLRYEEISALSGASRRTVERQILRARGKLARGENTAVRALQGGMALQPITHRGQVLATASPTRFPLSDELRRRRVVWRLAVSRAAGAGVSC